MNGKQAFAGLLQLVSVFSIFCAGFFFVSMSFTPHVRVAFAEQLRDKSDFSLMIGLVLFAVTLLLTVGFCFATQGRYLMLNGGVQLSARLLKKTIRPSLKQTFSRRVRLKSIDIQKGRHLQLELSLVHMEPEEKEKLLQETELHLTQLLRERFGYAGPFKIQLVSS